MDKVLNQIRRSQMGRIVILAIVGAWFIFAPQSVYGILKLLIVGGLVVMAIPALIAGFKGGETATYERYRGILLVVAALLVMVLLKPTISLLPFFVGVMLVIYGLERAVQAKQTQQYVNVSPVPQVAYGVLVAVVGVVLLFNPFSAVMMAVRVIGGILLVMAVTELVGVFKLK